MVFTKITGDCNYKIKLTASNLNEMIANHKSQQIEKTLSGIARPLDTLISNTNNTKQSIEKLNRNLAKVLEEVLEGDIS